MAYNNTFRTSNLIGDATYKSNQNMWTRVVTRIRIENIKNSPLYTIVCFALFSIGIAIGMYFLSLVPGFDMWVQNDANFVNSIINTVKAVFLGVF